MAVRKLILFSVCLTMFFSCKKNEVSIYDLPICQQRSDVLPPPNYDVTQIGGIEFNGTIKSFQFVTNQIGYALGGNNYGGYVNVFKTIDGGTNWTIQPLNIPNEPINMVFRDHDFGFISLRSKIGENCSYLKTINGGLTWEKKEVQGFTGSLHHPTFDDSGNLFAISYEYQQPSVVVKSTDNGENWDTLYSSPEVEFHLLTFSFKLFQDKLYVSGKDGKILVIDLNGNLLKTIETNKSSIWDLEIIDENNMIAVFSGEVIKTIDGGISWETIYNTSARMIGFETADKGLMMLGKSYCPTDVYQANDLISSTINGGTLWNDAPETTTNMRSDFANSQKMQNGSWYFMIDDNLFSISEK